MARHGTHPLAQYRRDQADEHAEEERAHEAREHLAERIEKVRRGGENLSIGLLRLGLPEEDVEGDDRKGVVERRLAEDEVGEQSVGLHRLEDGERGDRVGRRDERREHHRLRQCEIRPENTVVLRERPDECASHDDRDQRSHDGVA